MPQPLIQPVYRDVAKKALYKYAGLVPAYEADGNEPKKTSKKHMGIIPDYEISDTKRGSQKKPISSRAAYDEKRAAEASATSRRFEAEAEEDYNRYEAEMWSSAHYKAKAKRLSWKLEAERLEDEREEEREKRRWRTRERERQEEECYRERQKVRERENRSKTPYNFPKHQAKTRADGLSDDESRYYSEDEGDSPWHTLAREPNNNARPKGRAHAGKDSSSNRRQAQEKVARYKGRDEDRSKQAKREDDLNSGQKEWWEEGFNDGDGSESTLIDNNESRVKGSNPKSRTRDPKKPVDKAPTARRSRQEDDDSSDDASDVGRRGRDKPTGRGSKAHRRADDFSNYTSHGSEQGRNKQNSSKVASNASSKVQADRPALKERGNKPNTEPSRSTKSVRFDLSEDGESFPQKISPINKSKPKASNTPTKKSSDAQHKPGSDYKSQDKAKKPITKPEQIAKASDKKSISKTKATSQKKIIQQENREEESAPENSTRPLSKTPSTSRPSLAEKPSTSKSTSNANPNECSKQTSTAASRAPTIPSNAVKVNATRDRAPMRKTQPAHAQPTQMQSRSSGVASDSTTSQASVGRGAESNQEEPFSVGNLRNPKDIMSINAIINHPEAQPTLATRPRNTRRGPAVPSLDPWTEHEVWKDELGKTGSKGFGRDGRGI